MGVVFAEKLSAAMVKYDNVSALIFFTAEALSK
jgi:hypothetical protein